MFSIGPEFLPSYVDRHASRLIVDAGQTVTLDGVQDIDAIEVRGTLLVPGDLTLRYLTLTIAPGGRLVIGTAAQPNFSRVEFVKKDAPIDTDFDPFQWGHGVINFGEWIAHGRPMPRTWLAMQEAEAGATTLTVAEVPEGWQVGDELLLPDSQQLQWGAVSAVPKIMGLKQPIRNESRVTIAAIDGNVITLSKPLDHEHKAVRWHDGTIAAQPEVANLTRNIVFRSENPHGTRGHTVTTKTGRQNVQYCAFIDLGRTTGDPLNNTVMTDGVVEHVGTNQVGKYAEHRHHAHSHAGDHSIGNVYLNTGNAKWANSTHASHDVHHRDSIAHGFTGAGFVNEDGNETRITYDRCWASGCAGIKESIPPSAKFAFLAGRPGAEGSGFWLHGSDSLVMRDCRAWNNIIGFNIFHRGQVGGLVPSVPGGEPDRKHTHAPATVRRNRAISNAQTGFELWNVPPLDDGTLYRVDNQDCHHNGQNGVFFGSGEPGAMDFFSLWAKSTNGIGKGVSASAAYSTHVKVAQSRLEGFNRGLGEARELTHYEMLELRNVANVYMGGRRPNVLRLENIDCQPLPGFEPQPCIQAGFELDPSPEPEPEPQVWASADLGPPFLGDDTLRVRNGLIEKLQ